MTTGGVETLEERWWTAFGDAALDERVERALTDSFSLQAAWERLREARAFARQASADRAPELDGIAFAERREGDPSDATEIGLGLEASWEVDLWGRLRTREEAEELRARATAADYRAAALGLSAEVALAWYRLAEARHQLEVTESQTETNERVLQVLESRFAVGQSGSADVLRQRQLVEATREQALVARSRIEVLEHRLAVLEGRPPQDRTPTEGARLPDIPAPPATGLPAELVERRPDVRSAFLRLEAAHADVAAAVKERYPRIDLTAALSTTAERPSDLFEDWLVRLAGQLVAPLVDGGRRRAEVERTEAARKELLAEYGQTVLLAFQEVEDALALEASQTKILASLEAQLALAQSTYAQLRSQYLNGAADYLDILAAVREQQELERSLLTAQLEHVTFRIALYRALAGGFATPHDEVDSDDGDDRPHLQEATRP